MIAKRIFQVSFLSFCIIVFCGTTYSQKVYETIPVTNYHAVFVLKELNTNRYIVFANRLIPLQSTWKKRYKQVPFFKRLTCSDIFLLLSADYDDKLQLETETEIKRKDPSAEFLKPWMTNVVITLVSPWLEGAKTVYADKGQALGDVPVSWHLDRKITKALENFVKDELILAGTISFRLKDTELDFNQSFAIRMSDLNSV